MASKNREIYTWDFAYTVGSGYCGGPPYLLDRLTKIALVVIFGRSNMISKYG